MWLVVEIGHLMCFNRWIHYFIGFTLHLMKSVLGITNELSQALQRKDQNILNAMKLVEVSKQRLHAMREEGWNTLFEEVSGFCAKKKYCCAQYG